MSKRKLKDDINSLLNQIRQRHKDFLLGKLQDVGLKTSSRGAVLYAVFVDEGLVQDEISFKLSMDKAFVTRELNALSEMDLIYRQKDPQDHRRNHIFLTDNGREIGERIAELEEIWVEKAFVGISIDDFHQIKAFVERIAVNLRNN